MGTFDTDDRPPPEMPTHSPPQYLLRHGDEIVTCMRDQVKAAVAEMTAAHPGEFIDVYELRTCARLPLQPDPPKILLPGAH